MLLRAGVRTLRRRAAMPRCMLLRKPVSAAPRVPWAPTAGFATRGDGGSTAAWVPPSDPAPGRRPRGGGAHFPGGNDDSTDASSSSSSLSSSFAAAGSSQSHKTVVKVGENEWQASLMIGKDFHELGIFPSKAEAAAEVRDWLAVLNDSDTSLSSSPVGATAVPASWAVSGTGGGVGNGADYDEDGEPGASSWVQPRAVRGFDNPLLGAVVEGAEGATKEAGEDQEEAEGQGKQLISVVEAVESLQHENAVDVAVLDITTHRSGGSDLGDYVVFATGKSLAHLRKMGDVFVKGMQLRGQWDLDPAVEGRDSDDGWMIVDCGNVIVQLFLEEAREHFAVEELWVTNGCTKVPLDDVEAHDALGVIAERD